MNRPPVHDSVLYVDELAVLQGGNSAAGRLRHGWWVRALTHRERAAGVRMAPPAWAGVVERAVASATVPGELPATDSWQTAFAVPFRPFADLVRDRIADGTRYYLPASHANPETAADEFAAALTWRLAGISARTMAAELAAARANGRLAGPDERERADFIRWYCAPEGLAGLLDDYPVLARLLGTASLLAGDAGLELLARYAADRNAIVAALLGAVDPGPVLAIEPGVGDPHGKGRSVTRLSFADGRAIMYKPRSVAAHAWFGDVVNWLNERLPQASLRAASVLIRPGYGWTEFVDCQPSATPAEADLFYRHAGVLLAVLHVLDATDIHGGNLIASGIRPVPVDVETFFHPAMAVSAVPADPAAEMLAGSVRRTGLLSYEVADESGVTGRRLVGGQPGEPADHEKAVIDGFRRAYDAIASGRGEFARLIESARELDVRVLIRSADEYRRLLAESTDPDLMRDARDRDTALNVLCQVPVRDPLRHGLAPHEVADLWTGDIPLLTSRPASRAIWTSAGVCVPDVLDRPGLDRVFDKLAALGEVDKRDQEWIISASLAARRARGGHRGSGPLPIPLVGVAAEPVLLLAAACGLADQIVFRGVASAAAKQPTRVNWLGLQFVDDARWLVLPVDAGLAEGYLGIALFLAQLADLTGIGRYAEMARQAVNSVPPLLSTLTGQAGLLATVGCGGNDGLGGISYGLARMATLLDDAELGDWATTAAELAAAPASAADRSDWAGGSAGCLAAMTAVWNELGSPTARNLARATADRLAELAECTDDWCVSEDGPALSGFATGPAGIGWALARFAAATEEQDYYRAGVRAIACAVRRASRPARATADRPDGWCRGTAGLLIARSCMTGRASRAELCADLFALSRRPVLRDLSLCHGELGIAEAFVTLSLAGLSGAISHALRRRAGLILDATRRHAGYCGTPGGVPTPGLLYGLAGIGYGLLRLAFPQRVPAVLLLEPTPAPRHDKSVRDARPTLESHSQIAQTVTRKVTRKGEDSEQARDTPDADRQG